MHKYKTSIDRYINKWDKILFSTEPVDRDKATKAVIDAYSAIDLPPPEIFFLSSPSSEQNLFFHSISHDDNPYPIRVKCLMYEKIIATLHKAPVKIIDLDPRLTLDNLQLYARGEIFENLCSILYEHIYDIHCDRNVNFHKILEYELSGTNVWPFDFYINQISYKPDIEIWSILRSLCEECPYLITYEKVCLVIDRPYELYLDRELVAHAEGKAAIKYADGYELYCNHGTVMPAKYGRVHPSEWRSESIVSDEDNNVIREDSESIISVLMSIGYKKFSEELPDLKNRYWTNKKGSLKIYGDFIEYSLGYIPRWLYFHYYDYYNFGESYHVTEEIVDWEAHRKHLEGWYDREQRIYKNLPFKVTEELKNFYRMYGGDYRLAPRLDFQPLSKAVDNFKPRLNDYLLPISYGDRQEIYYVLCDNIQRPTSLVYCQFPNEEPIVYAECISSLMATIAQCYRDGGYYVAINERSGEKEIEQDLDKIEPIFEKFNPEQIDNWRKIWKPV
ncbi:hypothetical protein [Chamaesiphon sp. VAR_48_metabat_403]|uniref:hypothetical protein n=1 Tax=Chamaesiphon sp. VAR_48_metabat_403 TaxID=2964700 RepID=UPI00286E835E|nr:hypothetical protein [Chamaesiphon sp. VAR_48_metabat_403]